MKIQIRHAVARVLCWVLVAFGIRSGTCIGAEFWVAPNAKPGGDGSISAPFADPESARDAIRKIKRPMAPVTVWLQGGTYYRTNAFRLEVQDSGAPNAMITYRSRPGDVVRWVGGAPVKNWRKVTDEGILARLSPEGRTSVRVADLAALGITDYGALRPRGWGRGTQLAAMEAFFDGKPMIRARWPNSPKWSRIAGFPAGNHQVDGFGGNIGPIANGFFYSGDQPSGWKDATNIWTHGFWGWDWANSYERVAVLDPTRRFVLNAEPGGHFGFRTGNRFLFLNVFEELDSPGEYYIDELSGRIYIWPPSPENQAEVWVSLIDGNVIRTVFTQDVIFHGLIIEGSRGNGIQFDHGTRMRIEACVVRNTGNWGVAFEGGIAHSITGCDISDTGDGGVLSHGGNGTTLQPGLHVVDNCDFKRNGRWTTTYVPAVKLDGVGLTVSRCRIRDLPHIGVWFEGNDHVIEGNDISDVANETGDSGAIYAGRNWAHRGTIIRNNFIHEFRGHDGHAIGVYLDDCLSGITVAGNVFFRIRQGVYVAGGRDCVIQDNVFEDCEAGVSVDGRGVDNTLVWKELRKFMAAEFQKLPLDLYLKKYPRLTSITNLMETAKEVPPEGNVVTGNVSSNPSLVRLRWAVNSRWVRDENNVVGKDARIEVPASGRPIVSGKSKAWQNGFRATPWSQIGLRDEALRREVQRMGSRNE